MELNKIRLSLFMVILLVVQLFIDNVTPVYLDCFGVLLVILIAYNIFSIRAIIILSVISDLIGHWYIGTHLFACVFTSFLTGYLANYYKMTNSFQRYILLIIYYSLFCGLIFAINLLFRRSGSNIVSYLAYVIEIVLILPIIRSIVKRFLVSSTTDLFIR
jgi:cell shape-determining protein MreD